MKNEYKCVKGEYRVEIVTLHRGLGVLEMTVEDQPKTEISAQENMMARKSKKEDFIKKKLPVMCLML